MTPREKRNLRLCYLVVVLAGVAYSAFGGWLASKFVEERQRERDERRREVLAVQEAIKVIETHENDPRAVDEALKAISTVAPEGSRSR